MYPNCTVLKCNGFHNSAFYCTLLHCIALHCTLLFCTLLHITELYCTLLRSNELYCTFLHLTTVLYCSVLKCTTLHCAALLLSIPFCIPNHLFPPIFQRPIPDGLDCPISRAFCKIKYPPKYREGRAHLMTIGGPIA